MANQDERDQEGEGQACPLHGGKAQVAAPKDGVVGKAQMDYERPGQRPTCDRVAPQQPEQLSRVLRRFKRPQPKSMIDGVGENETGDDQAGDDVDLVKVHGLTGALSLQARGPSFKTKATLDGTGWIPFHPTCAMVPPFGGLSWRNDTCVATSSGLGPQPES